LRLISGKLAAPPMPTRRIPARRQSDCGGEFPEIKRKK